jgi:formylglycine-generating enzyme required for sulfatase activity
MEINMKHSFLTYCFLGVVFLSFFIFSFLFLFLKISSNSKKSYNSPHIGIMRYVPSGSFQRDLNKKNISIMMQGFYIMEKEVTYPQFHSVTGMTIRYNSLLDLPAKYVNWYQALIFCNKLSSLEGLEPVYTINENTDTDMWIKITGGVIPVVFSNPVWNMVVAKWDANGYRLPTEMEWVWAAMGARDKKNGYSKAFAGSNGFNSIDDYVWYKVNSNSSSHSVGTKLPNELGVYDMSGNVAEWCWDWYNPYLPEGKIKADSVTGKGPLTGTARVQRGGSWRDTEPLHSIENRYGSLPYDRDHYAGFRVVRMDKND